MTDQTRCVIMSIRIKKYKKLMHEVKYLRTELEYQEEVLAEYHQLFEEYYRRWCADNSVDIGQQEQQNAKRVEEIVPEPKTIQKHDKNDRIIPEKHIQDKLDAKKFNKLYKKIAMELHPDKDTGDADKFAKASDAYEKGFWSVLLEYALELDIEPDNLSEMLPLLKKEAEKIRKQIQSNSGVYSWKFYECEEDESCKERLIKDFLKHLFKLEI